MEKIAMKILLPVLVSLLILGCSEKKPTTISTRASLGDSIASDLEHEELFSGILKDENIENARLSVMRFCSENSIPVSGISIFPVPSSGYVCRIDTGKTIKTIIVEKFWKEDSTFYWKSSWIDGAYGNVIDALTKTRKIVELRKDIAARDQAEAEKNQDRY